MSLVRVPGPFRGAAAAAAAAPMSRVAAANIADDPSGRRRRPKGCLGAAAAAACAASGPPAAGFLFSGGRRSLIPPPPLHPQPLSGRPEQCAQAHRRGDRRSVPRLRINLQLEADSCPSRRHGRADIEARPKLTLTQGRQPTVATAPCPNRAAPGNQARDGRGRGPGAELGSPRRAPGPVLSPEQ